MIVVAKSAARVAGSGQRREPERIKRWITEGEQWASFSCRSRRVGEAGGRTTKEVGGSDVEDAATSGVSTLGDGGPRRRRTAWRPRKGKVVTERWFPR
jgi:hypothetical protein